MTKKTVKDLDAEIVILKNENSDLKNKYETLCEKYEHLEKKIDECVPVKSLAFQCKICGEEFGRMKDLKKHKDEKHTVNGEVLLQFECDECGKCVNEKWKLIAHKKKHKSFKCDKCSKVFKFNETRVKHMQIVHENVKLYCHYFNNDTVCPYKEECIFLHEDSEYCRYELSCERKLCMFKHCVNAENSDDENDEVETEEKKKNEKNEEKEEKQKNEETEKNEETGKNEETEKSGAYGKNEESENVEAIDTVEIVNDEPHDIIDVEDPESMNDNEMGDETFVNPSQTDNVASSKFLKCEMCDFKTSTRLDITNHKVSVHNWCSICFSSYNNQKQLKKHIKKIHENKKN